MNIESRTQEDKAVSEQMSIDEAKAFAKQLEEAIKNLDILTANNIKLETMNKGGNA